MMRPFEAGGRKKGGVTQEFLSSLVNPESEKSECQDSNIIQEVESIESGHLEHSASDTQ